MRINDLGPVIQHLAKTSELFLDEADEITIVKNAKTFKIKNSFNFKIIVFNSFKTPDQN